MAHQTDDLRISGIKDVLPPAQLLQDLPVNASGAAVVSRNRQAIQNILNRQDDRLLIIVGPCSVHDPAAARDYATRLLEVRNRLQEDLCIVMRVYFEKPRTTVGWKGLINDPGLNNSFEINRGLRQGRELLRDLAEMGLPAGSEFLDPISPQYIADLIAWGAIGARTTESQVHRELASGLSCPIGFKNATNGDVQVAVDAIRSASHPHHFLGVTKHGTIGICSTRGNADCHVILRGGKQTNYDAASIDDACSLLEAAQLGPRIMVDCSHANSRKIPERQIDVAHYVALQVARGDARIFGLMLESHLVAGRQDLSTGKDLVYGQSITDACIGWDDTVKVLDGLAKSVREQRDLAAA